MLQSVEDFAVLKHLTRRHFSLLVALALLLPVPGFAQGFPPSTLTARQVAAVDEAVRAEMEKQHVVGVAIGIIQKGQIVYLNGYGFEDKKKQVTVGPKTLFRWASISKTLTAVAAMQLWERKQLDLDADVRTLVPEFPDKGAVITPRLLLSHQSGIPHYNNGKIIVTKRNYTAAHPFEDVVVGLDTFKESPLIAPPGEKFSYSTYAFMLLSAVVQRAGNQKFADLIQSRIAHPLGMKTLQPDYQWLPLQGRASGYDKQGETIVPSMNTDVSWKLGGGGYISRIEDLARFAQGLIQQRLLSDKTFSLMWQPQKTKDGTLTPWGLGFNVTIAPNGQLKVVHEGQQEKSSCRMVLYPREGHGVVVMTNGMYAVPGEISTAIYAALKQK